MSGKLFLKNHLPVILLNLLGALALSLFLLAVGNDIQTILFILAAWVLVLALYLAAGYVSRKKRLEKLLEMATQLKERYLLPEVMPVPDQAEEQVYYQLLKLAGKSMLERIGEVERERGEYRTYIEQWVHEIKTPIAAMRLTLQGEDTPAARRLMTELGRVEQYVDMALTYLRLEEGGSDYVIRTCAVDDVVRAAVRRFAGEFIDRRIALDYTPVEWETVTDGKWLTFVVEQLLSNALKYTGQDGTIRIYREGDDLCIRDSGMGIAPEDLPRVFDMGYTGQNGRLDRRSSGIGLYLCRRICRNLRHEIRIESAPGAGTTVYLTLGRGDFLPE